MVRRAVMSDSGLKAELERLRAESRRLRNKDKDVVCSNGLSGFCVEHYDEKGFRILASIFGVDTAEFKANLIFKAASA
jgi:hypothetical protein